MKTIGTIWRYFAPHYPHPHIAAAYLAGIVLWGGLVGMFR